MKQKKHSAKPGFALLEAVVFVLLMILLSTAMLAAAFNTHRRSVERIENDRAYYAAVTALKMAGNDIASNPGSSYLNAFTNSASTLSVTPEGETEQVHAQITMSGTGNGTVSIGGKDYDGVKLTATATVAGETETVEMLLQKAPAETYPHTLYGAGFAGRLSDDNLTDTGMPTLLLGADTDLYLFNSPAVSLDDAFTLTKWEVGGNLAAQGIDLTLEGCSVAGSIISDKPLTLNDTQVGKKLETRRLSNVYSTSTVHLNSGTKIFGNVYANTVSSYGDVEMIGGSIFCNIRQLSQHTLFDAQGSAHLTTDTSPQRLSRTGTLRFTDGAGGWKTLNDAALSSPLANPLSDQLPMFVPNFPVDMKTVAPDALNSFTPTNEAVLCNVPDGGFLTLSQAPASPNGTPTIFVTLGKGATLALDGPRPFYLYVYGQGGKSVDNGSLVRVKGGATIYGSLQNVILEVENPSAGPVTINYVQPANLAYQAPASAGYTADQWHVVSIERVNPA